MGCLFLKTVARAIDHYYTQVNELALRQSGRDTTLVKEKQAQKSQNEARN